MPVELHELIKNSNELSSVIKTMPISVKNKCLVKKVEANKTLFLKGDILDCVYILCEGKVRIFNTLREGNIFTVRAGKGVEFIGEQGIIAGKKEAALTIESTTECILIKVEKKDFLYWIDKDHRFTKYLLTKLANRIYPISKDQGVRSFYSSSYLLKKLLIEEYKKRETNNNQILITRQQMAERIGISLRSVERGIKNLKITNKVTIKNRKLYINEKQYEELSLDIED